MMTELSSTEMEVGGEPDEVGEVVEEWDEEEVSGEQGGEGV